MAKRVHDTNLENRGARAKLKPRGKPYYRTLGRGVHLGYRKGQRAWVWVVRRYSGSGAYVVETIGTADDITDANGATVLNFWQAQDRAWAVSKTERPRGNYTVADAIAAYVEFLEHNRKTAYDVRKRMAAHALPALGKTAVEALTTETLRKWHTGLVKQLPRLRTKPGQQQKFRPIAETDEAQRRRRASANRCLAHLKAALNYAFNDGIVSNDSAWRKVKPFKGADAARIRYLTVAEAKRLLNACEPDFRNLVRAALETGCRYGELTRLSVDDFNPDVGTLAIRTGKTGARHVVLTAHGHAFFRQLCLGRGGGLMFLKDDGSSWRKSHQIRPMKEACHRANIVPPVGIHQLRHTWASLSVMNGVPLLVIAKNLGHADTRMVEKHYGHLAPSYVADAIRAGAPRFGKISASNVKHLEGGG